MPAADISFRKRLYWIAAFSIAMGFLEGAVVVYLRELYYPHGFSFPLTTMDTRIALVEILREVATIIMLLGIGVLAGRTPTERLGHFLLSFAIWDFFYYVFLKLVLDWPLSLLDWDILFLVPVPWVGPVITPVLITVTMTAYAAALFKRDTLFNRTEWILVTLGSLVVVFSWTIEFQMYARDVGDPMQAIASYVPNWYPWSIFFLGEAILVAAIVRYWMRAR